MKTGIMQPYFLPYIGYFALINAVDKFVCCDDIQYIRQGWVNRNRIKVENTWKYIILPIKKVPLTTNINEVHVVDDERPLKKIKNQIETSYHNAPNYKKIKDLVFKYLKPGNNIAQLNISLINEICDYLSIKTKIYISSNMEFNKSYTRENLIIEICSILSCNHYINPIGGIDLYSRSVLEKENIKLNFINMGDIRYTQGSNEFLPNLSILDVIMWNSVAQVKEFLKNYVLVEGTKI